MAERTSTKAPLTIENEDINMAEKNLNRRQKTKTSNNKKTTTTKIEENK